MNILIKEGETNERVCPRCKNTYSGYPALSRKDNETEICSDCGTQEAFEDWFKFSDKKVKQDGRNQTE